MLQLKSKVEIPQIDFTSLCTIDGGDNIMMAARQSTLPELPESLQKAVAEIAEIRKLKVLYVGVNSVPPGAQSGKHTDTLLVDYKVERWHLPLVTNKDAWILTGGKEINMVAGVWHGPFPYWEEHAVGNRGKEVRVHLVVDLDTNGEPIDMLGKSEPEAPPTGYIKPTFPPLGGKP